MVNFCLMLLSFRGVDCCIKAITALEVEQKLEFSAFSSRNSNILVSSFEESRSEAFDSSPDLGLLGSGTFGFDGLEIPPQRDLLRIFLEGGGTDLRVNFCWDTGGNGILLRDILVFVLFGVSFLDLVFWV